MCVCVCVCVSESKSKTNKRKATACSISIIKRNLIITCINETERDKIKIGVRLYKIYKFFFQIFEILLTELKETE